MATANLPPGKTTEVLLLPPTYAAPDKQPPLGIGYLAGYFRNHPSIRLEIPCQPKFDGNLERLLRDSPASVVATGGMLVYLKFFREFFALARRVRPDLPRVLGGPMASAFAPETLFQLFDIDAAVYGEGELSFEELIQTLAEGGPLQDVKGVMFRTPQGEIRRNPARPHLDLTTLDLRPNWDWFDMEYYFQHSTDRSPEHGGVRNLDVLGARGCPYRCHFCGSPLGGYRQRSPEFVVAEILELKERYKLDAFIFEDETLIPNSERTRRLCELLIERRVNLPWQSFMRANLADEEGFRLLKQAGCTSLAYGLESGSDRVLRRMNKKATVAQNKAAIQATRRAGLRPMISIMFGYLDETPEDLRATVDMMLELNELPRFNSHTTPVPGTPLYNECAARGLVDPDIVRYVERMNEGLDLTQPPSTNLTNIPGPEYYPTLLREKRRLYSEHFARNRAVALSVRHNHEAFQARLRCPHCEKQFEITARADEIVFWSHPHTCDVCHRSIWVDFNCLPDFRRHHDRIQEWLQGVGGHDQPVTLLTDAGPSVLDKYFFVEPWTGFWDRITQVSGLGRPFYHYAAVDPQQALRQRDAAILYLSRDRGDAMPKALGAIGFGRNRLATLLPPFPFQWS